MAVFNNLAGNQTFRGIEGTYDQVNYAGRLSDYTFTQLANGNVRVTHPTLGTDVLVSIEGFWFSGEARWYSLDDALAQTSGNGFLDADGVRQGTNGNDTLSGGNGDDVFYGGLGNDRYNGGAGYNQVNYDGSLLEYRVTENANGSVSFSHATWGDDVLTDIDGLWFVRESRWYSMEDAIEAASGNTGFIVDEDGVLNGTSGNDVMRGSAASDFFYGGTGNDIMDGNNGSTSTQYDQVNYDGAVSDYTFSRLADGSIRAEHPIWGVDTLINIEGIWFNGDLVWRSTDSLVESRTTRNVSEGGQFDKSKSDAPLIPETPSPDAFMLDDEISVDEISALLIASNHTSEMAQPANGALSLYDGFDDGPMDYIHHAGLELF